MACESCKQEKLTKAYDVIVDLEPIKLCDDCADLAFNSEVSE